VAQAYDRSVGAEEAYDAVVVGSGFGGSVMAHRLQEAGRRVLLLERGRPWPPGSFPRTPHDFAEALWDPGNGRHGLLDVWSFRGLGALVSSGLGGGSLIYANVLLRKEDDWFKEPPGPRNPWPFSYEDIVGDYEAVEGVIAPTPFPEHLRERVPKANAFFDAAAAVGLEAEWPPLAITFGAPGVEVGRPFGNLDDNVHGAQRYTCRLVGECDVGCNFGSKDSLDFTYLSRLAAGTILTRREVKAFRPDDGGWKVVVRDHESDEVETVSTKRLILSAGALGTPYLLLSNRLALPNLSPRIGSRFAGNGDLLTFASRCRELVEPARGPVITAAAHRPSTSAHDFGHVLEDGGYSAAFAMIAETLSLPRIAWAAQKVELKILWEYLRRGRLDTPAAEIHDVLAADDFRVARSLPLLGMGNEPPQGPMYLDDDGKLQIHWSFRRAQPYFEHVRKSMRAVAEQLGGKAANNALWRLNTVVTVHPVGGCPMGATAAEGVVDPRTGEVHGHRGLHVADGSVMPASVGVNPSLTIAAVANRFASGILAS
jgi:cholesterol oxidase